MLKIKVLVPRKLIDCVSKTKQRIYIVERSYSGGPPREHSQIKKYGVRLQT